MVKKGMPAGGGPEADGAFGRIVPKVTPRSPVEATMTRSADHETGLRAALPDARISQVYASTEFGSIASVGDGRPGLSVASLWSEDNPDGLLRVVDGQLWVRSGTGMSVVALEHGAQVTTALTREMPLPAGATLLMLGSLDQRRTFAETFEKE